MSDDMNFSTANACISVVLYSASAKNCSTLLSIEKAHKSLFGLNTHLVIWNNGPQYLTDDDRDWIESKFKWAKLDLIETTSNTPLSIVYNTVIDNVSANVFCFLDHDSIVEEDYLAMVHRTASDVMVPRIVFNGRAKGPKINRNLILKNETFNSFSGNLRTILSGLTISSKLVDVYKNIFGAVFDEKYSLYGVDSSFFIRLDVCIKCTPMTVQVFSSFTHSLSRLEVESSDRKAFRKIERGLDLGISIRNYPCLSTFEIAAKEALRTLVGKQHLQWTACIRGYISGRHPKTEMVNRPKLDETNFR